MRSHLRTIIVLVLAAALLGVFFYNVDLRSVAREIVHAHPGWLLFSLVSMFVNLALRAWRWQYLLAPLGMPSFANAFRATTVGFAASAVLPARAGEVIRPYFLSRHEKVSATGAFATVILERLLDMITVLALLAFYVFIVRPNLDADPAALEAVKWTSVLAAAGALAALAVLFVLAGHPARLGAALGRLERVVPSALAGLLARVAEKFASGLAVIRRPGRLAVSLVLSIPLWLSIAAGIWAVAVAFRLAVPFSGSFLVVALLVVGVAVPTPGAVGGFHEAFRFSATTFFGASNDAAVAAAIVLHLMTIGPQLLLGLFFAAQEGLNLASMQRLAERKPQETT
jgi:glycosyltransferase 2 family protein